MLDRRSFGLRALGSLGAVVLGALTVRRTAAPAPASAGDAGQVWMCTFHECDPYYYDPAVGDPINFTGDGPIPPGIAFQDLPRTWRCPVCGVRKSFFVRVDR